MAANSHPELPVQLAEWMRRQRWYANKGSVPLLERRGGWELIAGDARIETHYVLDRQARGATLYQVPLTVRSAPLDGVEPLWQEAGEFVYDAPRDPEYARALLDVLEREVVVGGARGHRQPGARPVTIETSAVLSGEQSNTSIICAVDGGSVMLKIFRTLHSGENPDVVLQSAISAAGSTLVPASLGYLSGEWPDPSEEGGVARGHLAFAQDFLSSAEDGWRIALRAAEAAEDFSLQARHLGRATAELHATLAEVLPTAETRPADVERFITRMRSRADSALVEVPELEPRRREIEQTIQAAASAAWPPLQRIHGDYHLGQVLAVPEAGSLRWVIIDFEGEPLRPMRERSAGDIALRDVAGMVRSFDYAAGAVAHRAGRSADEAADAWAMSARTAFLDGYAEAAGGDLDRYRAILDAFELDKALYEALYEARNRPDWLGIPVTAIHGLIGN